MSRDTLKSGVPYQQVGTEKVQGRALQSGLFIPLRKGVIYAQIMLFHR